MSLEIDRDAWKWAQGFNQETWELTQTLRLDIWTRIVAYANADFTPERAERNGQAVDVLIRNCVRYIDPTIGQLFLRSPAGFSSAYRAVETNELSIVDEATKHHGSIRQLLRWIASPRNITDEEALSAFEFLRANVDSIKSNFEVQYRFHLEQRHNAFWHDAPSDFQTLLSPVCQFIWLQIDRYRTGGDELKKILPVGSCLRPGCERFFVINRIGTGLYCSSKCRTMHWQSTNKDVLSEKRRRQNRLAKLKSKVKDSGQKRSTEIGKGKK